MLQSRISWYLFFSASFDLELATELKVIFEFYQNARNERKKVIEKYETKSKEMQALNKIIRVWGLS